MDAAAATARRDPTATFPWRRKRLLLLLVLTLVATLTSGIDVGGPDPVQYCSPNKPLSTKLFVPFLEEHRHISEGCTSAERTTDGLVLHAVKIATNAKNVLLTVTESELDGQGIVLVLQSASPIGWRLAFVGRPPPRLVVALSDRSFVHTSNVEVTSKLSLDGGVGGSSEDLLRHARRKWGGVTTFSDVSGANRISVLLSPSASASKCQLGQDDDDDSAAVNAYFVSVQPVFGCFHREMSGVAGTDVHIIDLASADGLSQQQQEEAAAVSSSEPPPVYLTLKPEESGGGARSLRRNITLVLRSALPVKWMLQSVAIEGVLTVISEGRSPVQDLSLAPTQTLDPRTRDLASDFEGLWRLTLAETGAVPVSYMRLAKANVISLVIPPKSKEVPDVPTRRSHADNVAQLYEGSQNDLAEKRVLIPGKDIEQAISRETGAINALVKKVEAALVKHCSPSETVVTVSRKAVDKFGVVQMSLNDPTCTAEKNLTHWILKSQSTSCGSLNMFSGKNPMFSNNVVLEFSPSSSFYRKAVRVPFSCRFKPGLLGDSDDADDDDASNSAANYDDDARSDDPWDDEEDTDEMYVIRVHRRKQLLVERRGESANVFIGDELRVATDFETRSFLNLAIEQCWLTDKEQDEVGGGGGAHAAAAAARKKKLLIVQGCPVQNVTVFSTDGNLNPSFAFTLGEEHLKMQKLYLYCLIGLCSNVENLASGNIGMCVDPSKACASSVAHHAPVAQQLTRRGPLFVHPFLQPYAAAEGEEEEEHVNHSLTRESPGLHSSHVVMVGIPAEIAVAIALASFIIGASLTGILCCIHHRKAVPKTVRDRNVNHHADVGELQSMMTASNPNGGSSSAHNNNGHATTNC